MLRECTNTPRAPRFAASWQPAFLLGSVVTCTSGESASRQRSCSSTARESSWSTIRHPIRVLDGRFDGEPIGFADGAPHASLIHPEIVRLNCRFITALFAVRSVYTTTRVDDNRLHDLAP